MGEENYVVVGNEQSSDEDVEELRCLLNAYRFPPVVAECSGKEEEQVPVVPVKTRSQICVGYIHLLFTVFWIFLHVLP